METESRKQQTGLSQDWLWLLVALPVSAGVGCLAAMGLGDSSAAWAWGWLLAAANAIVARLVNSHALDGGDQRFWLVGVLGQGIRALLLLVVALIVVQAGPGMDDGFAMGLFGGYLVLMMAEVWSLHRHSTLIPATEQGRKIQ